MDQALWFAHRCLSRADRSRWVRSWIDDEDVPAELVGRVLRSCSRDERRRRWEDAKAACARFGVECIDPFHSDYPVEAFRGLADPPGHMFACGDSALLRRPQKVAVVGARRGSARGPRIAESMAGCLARADVVVVSGLALGIDGAAHRGCLDADGKTIAIMAGGPEVVYPPSHRSLYERVAATGLIVSEHPPGTPARREHFVARNRLIAALGRAVVVVEAGLRSGTRSTVDFALDLGREVMAVPGPVDCPHAQGVLQLLRDGALLVRGGEDVLESLGLQRGPASSTVLDLGLAAESSCEIADRTGLPLQEVLAILGEAELSGRVRRFPGDRWSAVEGS